MLVCFYTESVAGRERVERVRQTSDKVGLDR